MNRTCGSVFFLGVAFLGALAPSLYAIADGNVTFGSRNSAIKVSSGAKLNVSSSGLTIDGSLVQASGATVAGQDVAFDYGILEQAGAEALIKGTYSPSTSALKMVGNSIFKFEPGTVVPGVTVSGTGNRLEGQPLFSSAITMNNSSARLTLALYSTLNKNITLNSSTVTLDNDLALADEVKFIGPGTVNVNYRQLTLGGYYSSTWNTALTFNHATSVYLTGYTALGASGHWTFPGTARVNGNGETLDLSAGGQITIPAGAKLYLEDISIKGLGTGKGRINFGSATSELHLSNVSLTIDTDMAIASGKVIIDDTTTFVLKGNVLNFLTDGKLTVNGTTLWLEVLDRIAYPNNSKLLFGSAWYVYDTAGYNLANVNAAIAAGLLTLSDNGAIKETTDQSEYTADEQAMFSGDLKTSISLQRSLPVNPGQLIKVTGSATINGNGVALTFSQTADPQFEIADGVTVTLRNIELSKLRSTTFKFGQNAHLRFGADVTLELSEDLTFESNTKGSDIAPLLRVIGENTLTLRGLNGKQVVSFVIPTATNSQNQITQRPIQLSDNTLRLENIECIGLDASVLTPGIVTDGDGEFPSIELIGNTSFDIRGKKNKESDRNEQPKTSLDFFVEGENNALVFLRDGINYGGSVTYGSLPINDLHVKFAVNEDIQNLTKARTTATTKSTVTKDYPYVTLSGEGFYVGSPVVEGSDPVVAEGTARLSFDNHFAAVEIADSNAFQLDTGAELFYKNLLLLGNDVIQNSSDVTIAGERIEGTTFDTTGVRSVRRDVLAESLSEIEEQELRKLDDIAQADDVIVVNGGLTRAPRTLSLPRAFDRPTTVNGFEALTSAFAGNLAYESSTIKNFSTVDGTGNSADYPAFNLVLENDNQISLADKNMSLRAETQKINVRGKGNVINVRRTFTINNNLYFAEGSELTFNFVEGGNVTPQVIFADDCLVNLEKKVILRFQGSGKVVLSDGVVMNFKGYKEYNSRTGVETVTDKPKFVLTDNAVLDFVAKAATSFKGIGTIEITNAGMIAPSTIGTMVIGNPATTLDDIDLIVWKNGEVRLDVPTIPDAVLNTIPEADRALQAKARISFQNVTTTIMFKQSGTLTVGDNALFEINTSGRNRKRGRVRTVSFGYDGQLFIKGSGKLSIASNQTVSALLGMDWNGEHVNRGVELPFKWFGTQSRMGGDGLVEYVAPANPDPARYRGFTGTFAPTKAGVATDNASILAEDFVRLLIS